jgi:3-oxoacyl-[acyl-carrier protein] reductase
MDLGINGRTAIVLGATAGLGAATATALAEEGANVVVVGRNGERARELASRLPSAVGVEADVTDPISPQRILEATRDTFGEPDIVVLNGGGPRPGPATDLDVSSAQESVDLLLKPHVALVQLVLGGMVERGWGRIVAIGSSGVQQPLPDLAASNVGRAALAGFLKSLATEVADRGVTVNMVLPGRIDTDRVASLDQNAATKAGTSAEEARAASERTIPAGRYGEPAEFAAVVTFLASDRAGYVTGEQVRCDGGLVRHH